MDSRYCSIQSHLSLDVMLHYQHTSFLSSNQATELTRLGSIAESPSKDDIIFKHSISCMHRQTDTTHRPYISRKKKEKKTPPYLWDQGNLSSVLYGYPP